MSEEKKRFPLDFPVEETEFYVRWAKTERRYTLVEFARASFELFVRLPLPFRELVMRREWDQISRSLERAPGPIRGALTGTAEDGEQDLDAIEREGGEQERRGKRRKTGEAS